ncbi:MAG: cob(I)yrinic acid a,c-diamide adenosyltransferase [Nitrososphaeraceae archaeon]
MEQSDHDGLIISYIGNGKGKTTAALGIVLRAVGHGQKALMIQFIKGKWFYGEMISSKKLEPNFELIVAGKGFVGILDDIYDFDIHKKAALNTINIAKEKIISQKYDVVVLDEINYALKLNLITVDQILELIDHKPKKTTIVLTGNYLAKEIEKHSDIITQMIEIKHPYNNGIKAKQGIDY